ncbi:hypothetical protein BDZ91DRAFT_720813 [Kalaharituber pfeilii]|nr:hypothetical protein BDZ91DRAFT_720813 [Kalaharituber pfeilii]
MILPLMLFSPAAIHSPTLSSNYLLFFSPFSSFLCSIPVFLLFHPLSITCSSFLIGSD